MAIENVFNNIERTFKLILDNIEKIFRYLVPAFVFNLMLTHIKIQGMNDFLANYNGAIFAVFFVLEGITIYSLHRTAFEAFDFLLVHFGGKNISSLISASCRLDDKTKDYIYYKMATIHSALLTTEIVIFFLIYDGWSKYKELLCFFAVLFGCSLYVYCRYHYVQVKIAECNESPKS